MDQKLLFRAIERIPVPSSVLCRLARVTGNPTASASDVAATLQLDPALSGKVLRLANSAYVGIPRTVSSLPNAVVLLGMKRIYALAITSELIAPLLDSSRLPFSTARFRRHSVTVAFIAEAIGRCLKRYDSLDEHELFSCGLLHDIGKLPAGTVDPEGVTSVYRRSRKLRIPFFRAEKEEMSHTALGLTLANKWHFSPELSACIRGHHTPVCFPELHRLVSVIHIADVMAHLLGVATYPDEKAPQVDDAALEAVRLPPERLRVIGEDALKQQEKIASMLEILDV